MAAPKKQSDVGVEVVMHAANSSESLSMFSWSKFLTFEHPSSMLYPKVCVSVRVCVFNTSNVRSKLLKKE